MLGQSKSDMKAPASRPARRKYHKNIGSPNHIKHLETNAILIH